MFNNTEKTYGLMSKIFHWTMALIILGLLVMGFFMKEMPNSPDKFELYGLHKSFGLLILWLVGLRLAWNQISRKPKHVQTHKKWEKLLSKTTHVSLYIAMIGMPLTGWFMSMAGGYGASFFGLKMPNLIDKNPALGKAMNLTHEYLAYLLIATISLHVLGALKHHFIDKDETFTRMSTPKCKIARIGIFVIAALFYAALVKILIL